jgi:hypothetical protein
MVNPQADDKRVDLCNRLLVSHLQSIENLPEGLLPSKN